MNAGGGVANAPLGHPLASGAGATSSSGTSATDLSSKAASMEKEIIGIEDDAAAQREKIATDLARKLDDINENAISRLCKQARKLCWLMSSKLEQRIQPNKRPKRISSTKIIVWLNELAYENKMEDLQEQFLFTLEDALRARDASKVLKDIEKYSWIRIMQPVIMN